MNTQSNKAFEDAMCSEHYAAAEWVKTWIAAVKDYKHLTTSWAWRMWNASSQYIKKKYVLLPPETALEVLNWAKEAKWNSPNKETDMTIKKHITVLNKAIVNWEKA